MTPNEELYPGSDFENDMPDQETTETAAPASEISDDTFGEQIVPEQTEMDESPESDQIGTETPLDQLRDEQTY